MDRRHSSDMHSASCTRILRRKAVRVIESAWKDWQFHSEQANTAARDTGSTPFHAFHAERRERALALSATFSDRLTLPTQVEHVRMKAP